MSKSNGIEIRDQGPSADDFIALRAVCGWGSIPKSVAELALSRSIIGVKALLDGKFIGCGRVVGDGILYFYIQDVMVLPEFRSIGVGTAVMKRIMSRLDAISPPGATIGLMSAQGKEAFYERFHFKKRPDERYGAGMTQFRL